MRYREFKLSGKYVSGWQSASSNWEDDIVANQFEVFPEIREMCPGTFNVRLEDPSEYVPWDIPLIRAKRDRSCISQIADVILINGKKIRARIYNGGWPADTVELLSKTKISEELRIATNESVTLLVREKLKGT